jgi:hypothetical protein
MNKYIFYTSIFLLFAFNQLSAQKWKKIDQSTLGFKYKLPADWPVDGFGGGDFEQNGSSVCDCAGTINIGNQGSDTAEIFMVVYPTLIKDSVDALKRKMMWGMEFDPEGTKKTVTTSKCVFQETISKWKEGLGGNYPDSEVWQFKTSFNNNQFYVIYFWARPSIMKANAATLMKIVESFTPVKVKK